MEVACKNARALLMLALSGCAPATQAALIPRLNVGLRSALSENPRSTTAGPRVQRRWDLTVFADLAWASPRSAALIPSRNEFSPDAWWPGSCVAQDCVWNEGDESVTSAAPGAPP